MTIATKSRVLAHCCALALLTCSLATYPVAEIGMNDDGSYIKTAQVLARTGHVVYNGWATAMLGWQLYLGAFFADLFGPSFTAIRASTLSVALLTAFLIQRTFVRAGINPWNATLGTLTIVLSPLFLPLTLSFMSDVGGLFTVVVCLYACIRALQAGTDRTTCYWLAFAALTNAAGGTSRQIAWLGVLVMFPCTVWLLRTRRNLLPLACFLYAVSITAIFCSVNWFLHQPYSIPEKLLTGQFNSASVSHLTVELVSEFLTFALFLLPILSAFYSANSLRNGRTIGLLAFGAILTVTAILVLANLFPDRVEFFIAPFKGNYVTIHGLVDGTPIKGRRPIVLGPGPRAILTFAVLAAINCFLSILLTPRQSSNFVLAVPRIDFRSLLTLTVPFGVCYVALLIPRGLVGDLFDRYTLPILFVGAALLLRLYEDRVGGSLPRLSVVVLLLFAAFAIAGTHDAFGLYRAKVAAIDELRAAGVNSKDIDGGFEYNSMVQIEALGYVNDPRIRVPANLKIVQPPIFPGDCTPQMSSLTPAINPGYALSFDPTSCGGGSPFAPVTFRNWLGWREDTLYVVSTSRPSTPSH